MTNLSETSRKFLEGWDGTQSAKESLILSFLFILSFVLRIPDHYGQLRNII